MSRRRIAVLGVCIAAVTAGTAIWILGRREPPFVPPAPSATTSVDPPAEVPAPVVARRTKKPPDPYLPPYEKPPHLLTEPVRVVYAEETPKWPRLFGRVVSDVDQAPLRDVVIGVSNEFTSCGELRESILMFDDVKAVARTDGDGRFELEEPVVGSVFIATASGSGPVLFDRDWLGRTHEAPFVIALAPSATFKARITDRVGTPKPGVEIRLVAFAFEATHRGELPYRRILSLMVGARRVTDDNGLATFAGIPAEVPFEVEFWSGASRLRRESTEIVLEPGQEISKEWQLGTGRTVRGRVVDDAERPVVGQKLLLTQRDVSGSLSALRTALQWQDEEEATQDHRTDADGRFSIDDVGPGKWRVGIAPRKPCWLRPEPVDFDALAPVSVVFEVEPDRDPVDLLLRTHRGLYIQGITLDPEGLPVLAGLVAHAKTDDSSFFASASADAATGKFVIGPLEPGEYLIEASPHPVGELRNSGSPPGPPLAPIDPLRVRAGREDLVITFGLGGSIRATARRADTGAKVAAGFWLAPAENPEECDFIMHIGPIDTTRFTSLKAGTYAISAVTPDGSVGCARDIRVGTGQRIEDVEVRVEPGARLKLTYAGTIEEYAQVTILGGSTVFGADGIKKGTSAIFVAPVGKVTVRWRAGADHLDEEIDLAVGETRDLSWPRPK